MNFLTLVLVALPVLYISWRVFKSFALFLLSTKRFKQYKASSNSDLSTAYNVSLKDYKLELFRQLANTLKKVGGDVLEIGVGSGANLEFYPKDCCLIALDPSSEMRQLFEAKNEKHSYVNIKRFIQGYAEDLSEISDISVGVIVCTKVMCSVRERRRALLEFKRVLKPVREICETSCKAKGERGVTWQNDSCNLQFETEIIAKIRIGLYFWP